jgi:ubiquinol-cytochrome c reductase cytochrome c1 subunit
MKELKVLAVVVGLTLVMYWGVEPYAHHAMHPEVEKPNYEFTDVDGLGGLTGDATNGATLVQSNCTACHSIESKGFPPVMDDATSAASYGVVPPDLGTAGKLYNGDYLAAFIKNPAKAAKVEHKYEDGAAHPMPGYGWMQPQEIADMVAYLQSIAPEKMTNKEVFIDACQRCHGIKYADMKNGTMAAKTPEANIKSYMGKIPPDLSQYIRSRSVSYLHEFVNDPQKHLEGTAMPRVGLTKDSEEQAITYMEDIGDSKKSEREALGPKFLIYLVIFAIFGFLWKAAKWRDVH